MTGKKEIEKILEPIINRQGFDLIELKLGRFKKTSRLQIYADSDNGITIDQCVELSRLLEPVLESENVFNGPYVIEVSSPGLDRPLKTERDFARRVGEKMEIDFINDDAKVSGVLKTADDQSITLDTEAGAMDISLDRIKQGIIVF